MGILNSMLIYTKPIVSSVVEDTVYGSELIDYVVNTTSRTFTAVNTYQDIPYTSITFTPSVDTAYKFTAFLAYAPHTDGWERWRLRAVVNGNSISTPPYMDLLSRSGFAYNYTRGIVTHFIFGDLAAEETTVKLQTADGNTDLTRYVYQSVVTLEKVIL